MTTYRSKSLLGVCLQFHRARVHAHCGREHRARSGVGTLTECLYPDLHEVGVGWRELAVNGMGL